MFSNVRGGSVIIKNSVVSGLIVYKENIGFVENKVGFVICIR